MDTVQKSLCKLGNDLLENKNAKYWKGKIKTITKI